MNKYAIGADIGGSHISCALVNLAEGKLVDNSLSERDINNQAEATVILNGWAEALRETMDRIDLKELAGIGFAMPGPFAYDKGIALFEKVAKFESLYGINVAEELKKLLDLDASIPLRFMNDASSFAVGEAWFGGAADVEKSVSLTLGTGFGSAFVDKGIPVVEGPGIPSLGCLWHLPYKEGIADDYFSTRWFIKQWKEKSGKTASGVKEIAEEATSNAAAKELFIEYGSNIGEFLGPWMKDFNAGVLVIGGNITGAWELFRHAFTEGLEKAGSDTRVVISKLKESAAIVGSARMIQPEFWKHIEAVLPKM